MSEQLRNPWIYISVACAALGVVSTKYILSTTGDPVVTRELVIQEVEVVKWKTKTKTSVKTVTITKPDGTRIVSHTDTKTATDERLEAKSTTRSEISHEKRSKYKLGIQTSIYPISINPEALMNSSLTGGVRFGNTNLWLDTSLRIRPRIEVGFGIEYEW